MIKIKIYEHGQINEYHIPKRYEKMMGEVPLHELVAIIKKDAEEKERRALEKQAEKTK
jgi:hypothetical protein